jgi:Family of unknown function (DUF6272)
MYLYCYYGPFLSKDLIVQSTRFREVTQHLNCEYQQAYDLFSSFIELFRNIVQHAARNPLVKDLNCHASSITLSLIAENHYKLQSQNFIAPESEHSFREKIATLGTLKEAKENAVIGLYLLNSISKHTFSSNLEKNIGSPLNTLTLTTYCR